MPGSDTAAARTVASTARTSTARRRGVPGVDRSVAGLPALLEWLPLGGLVVDGADEIVHANGRAGEWLGRVARGPLGATFARESVGHLHALLARARRDGDLVARDVRVVPLDGAEDGPYDLWFGLLPAERRDEAADGTVLVLLDRSQARDFTGREAGLDAVRRMGEGMATALAHEIRNPLAGIRGAAQLLEARCAERDRRLTRLIRDEVDRIDRLVGRVAALSRPDEARVLRPLNIHEVLDHVVALCRAEQAAGGAETRQGHEAAEATVAGELRMGDGRTGDAAIAFERLYDPSLPLVPGDRDGLIQVFLNLVRNACEALAGQGGGRIRLRTAYRYGLRRRLEDGRVQHLPIEVRIEDDGPGVPQSLVPHLFEAFVSGRGTGRGLGLALVGRIVREHGGLIRHEAARGGGAVFVLNLPAVREDGGGEGGEGEGAADAEAGKGSDPWTK